jgi:hypothetical protein
VENLKEEKARQGKGEGQEEQEYHPDEEIIALALHAACDVEAESSAGEAPS